MKIKKIATLLAVGAFFLNYLNANSLEDYTIMLSEINEEMATTHDISADQFTNGIEACVEGNALTDDDNDPTQIEAFKNEVTQFNEYISHSDDPDADNQEAKDTIAAIVANF